MFVWTFEAKCFDESGAYFFAECKKEYRVYVLLEREQSVTSSVLRLLEREKQGVLTYFICSKGEKRWGGRQGVEREQTLKENSDG